MSSRLYLQHPEDDQLLAFADGELHGLAASRIRRHLKECWRCRTQLEDLQSTVTGFMRYKEQALEANVPPAPAEWKNLAQDFERIDRSTPAPSFGRRIASRVAGMPGRVAMVTGALAVVGLASYMGVLRMDRSPVAAEPVVAPRAVDSPIAPISTPAAKPPAETAAKARPPVEVVREPVPDAPNAEVQVIVALHRVGADLGEPIEVTRDPNGRVLVTGMAIGSSRQSELKLALGEIPGVRLRWEESTPISGNARQTASIQAHKLAWQAELEGALGGPAQVEQFTLRALDLSDQVVSRAYALRALDTRFGKASLSDSERQEVARIAADHRQELKQAARHLNDLITPVLDQLGGKISRDGARLSLFESARSTDQALNALLAGAGNARALGEILPELGRAAGQLMKVTED